MNYSSCKQRTRPYNFFRKQNVHTDTTNKNPKFKSYYTYFYGDLNSDGIIYDVDSHIEFYKIKKERKV